MTRRLLMFITLAIVGCAGARPNLTQVDVSEIRIPQTSAGSQHELTATEQTAATVSLSDSTPSGQSRVDLTETAFRTATQQPIAQADHKHEPGSTAMVINTGNQTGSGDETQNDQPGSTAVDIPPEPITEDSEDVQLAPAPLMLPSNQPDGTHDELGDETTAGDMPDAELSAERICPDTGEWLPQNGSTLELDEIISSIYQSYPMLESAIFGRNVASGEVQSAMGEFDLKLKAASENNALGFYQNYRQHIGFVQPRFEGGDFFAGYRVGNGFFQPWYLERETNEGGEFKVGFNTPLARNRDIDERRADLWRANIDRQIVEPDIQAQLIDFVLEGSFAYWDWVAAGAKYEIANNILRITRERNERFRRQVETGLIAQAELDFNNSLIAERMAKLAESERKLRQTAVKLSIFYRDINGDPVLPNADFLPEFPPVELITVAQLSMDSEIALQVRPEIQYYDLLRRSLQVDFSQARNDLLPSVDAMMTASQDFGLPTSSKNDKGEFELEASLFVDVPLQRNKARGKIRSVQGKMAQLTAKRRFLEDKIVADVQTAYAGLIAAYEQAVQAEQAVELNQRLLERELRNLEAQLSDMIKVNFVEEKAIESALKVVDAKLAYFIARAQYRAALGQDQLP